MKTNSLVNNSAAKAVDALLTNPDVRQAIVYIRPDLTVKLTRTHRSRARQRQESYVLTIGKPAFAERRAVKLFQDAGEPFPVKKVQLRFWSKPKKK